MRIKRTTASRRKTHDVVVDSVPLVNDPGSTIWVTATDMEQQLIAESMRRLGQSFPVTVIGLGLVESAVEISDLLRRSEPRSVCLIGIAGSFDSDLDAVGMAVEVGRCMVDGIGVGCNIDTPVQTAVQLGWHKHEFIVLDREGVTALSVAAASGSPIEADDRRARFPAASIEDMESYSVARVCQTFGVPLRVIRGISNQVGDREHSRWQIAAALDAAVEKALQGFKR